MPATRYTVALKDDDGPTTQLTSVYDGNWSFTEGDVRYVGQFYSFQDGSAGGHRITLLFGNGRYYVKKLADCKRTDDPVSWNCPNYVVQN